MDEIWNGFKTLINPQSIITYGGVFLLIFVIFAETGLFFGFFLPGDSLLFISGLFCANSEQLIAQGKEPILSLSIFILIPLMVLAGIFGNYVGYWFGWRVGPALFQRKDSFFFRRRYLLMAEDFYKKHGGLALIMGRFLPIIRTFAPIFAGLVKVDFKRFSIYNMVGSFLWIVIFTLLGYFLGKSVNNILDYLHYIVIGLVLVTTTPVLLGVMSKRANK